MIETEPQPASASPMSERIVYALRQAGFLAVALVVAGLVSDRLRPDQALDRGMVSTPFLWAVVLWCAVLLLNAIAFDRTQMRTLERGPLYGALGVSIFIFVTGLVSFDAGSFARRVVYLVATSVGALMFWWALLSLCYLITRRVRNQQ